MARSMWRIGSIPVIGHYQASYADPRRDKTRGRIWRITAKGRAPVKQPNARTR